LPDNRGLEGSTKIGLEDVTKGYRAISAISGTDLSVGNSSSGERKKKDVF